MAHKPLFAKVALARMGAIAAGVAGVLAITNWLASARQTPRRQPAEPDPAASGADSLPAHEHASAARGQPQPPEIRQDWQRLGHTPLPQPTYWPAVMALGIVFLAWGLVTSVLISVVGLILFALALAGWIRELRHGH